jgi:isoamylase
MRLPTCIELGRAAPLGATVTATGVNFAVGSEHASAMEVCVFDGSGAREIKRYRLHGPEDGVFHGELSGLGAGLVYGLRAHGPYAPEMGHRFNPNKLLLDPYASEIVGHFSWRAEHHGYELGHPNGDRSFDTRDNALHALKARVAAPLAPLVARRPRHGAGKRVLYEVHVKGFTQCLATVPEALRGTYAGMAHPAAISHLKSLGVTTVSLLPVHYALDEPHLHDKGLNNYWGYNTLGFFAPSPRLAAARHDPTAIVAEFRAMVDALHAADIEVVLDVVYNHTPEGNEAGPTLSFRGLDNALWYRLNAHDKARYDNYTGCGNTLNIAHPVVTRLVLDSLRYWVSEMGVDGFRFDLAPVLGRTRHHYDPHAAFFVALQQDPVLADVLLIAEPWDVGPEGYQLGHFPGRFLEWNDKFRDTVRRYWLSRSVSRGEFARRFTASSDVFQRGARRPTAGINYITVHDGFCLTDVVSYSRKHNHANGEDNRDGRDDEPAHHFGVEGAAGDAGINVVRGRVKRALLATLLLAQGTPMLCAGDEIGKTQQGNNNPYCQDNALSWLDWANADAELAQFVSQVIALRAREPLLRQSEWFIGHGDHAAGRESRARLKWLAPSGHEMQVDDWHQANAHTFACQMFAPQSAPVQNLQTLHTRRSILIAFNPELCAAPFTLPHHALPNPLLHNDAPESVWHLVLDTAGEHSPGVVRKGGGSITVAAHSLVVLCESS